MNIKIAYLAVDGFYETRQYKTLAGAQRYARRRVGLYPERGVGYAISGDGVGRITIYGDATVEMLFPGEGGISTAERREYDEDTLGDAPDGPTQYQYDAQERMQAEDRW